jgi:hypothetical protein
MPLSNNQKEFTIHIANLIVYADNNGYTFRFGDAWRSTDPLNCPDCGKLHSYQELLISNGRSKEIKSKHCDRLAVDFIIERKDLQPMEKEDWDKLGLYWESLNGRWGGRFGVRPEDYNIKLGWDAGHFEWVIII